MTWVWWLMHIILVLKRLRQEITEFQAKLHCIAISKPAWTSEPDSDNNYNNKIHKLMKISESCLNFNLKFNSKNFLLITSFCIIFMDKKNWLTYLVNALPTLHSSTFQQLDSHLTFATIFVDFINWFLIF